MVKQEQALEVLSELELQQEKFLMLVVHGINGDGQGLSVREAGHRCHIDAPTYRRWWRSKYVQDRVREELELGQTETRLAARKHRDHALATLRRATDSPAMKAVQVRAAIALLQFGELPEDRADTQVALQVVVHQGLPGNAIADQAARHSVKVVSIPAENLADDVAEGTFAVVD